MKEMNSFEEDIFSIFLDEAVEDAKKSFKNEGKLTIENAIPVMLKSQFNHIAHLQEHVTHLEENMVTKAEFRDLKKDVNALNTKVNALDTKVNALDTKVNALDTKVNGLDGKFNGLKQQVNNIKWMVMFGFVLLSVLITLLGGLQVYTTFIK